MKRAFAAIFSVAAMVFFMAGCSSVRLVDTDVTAFSRWSAAPPGPGTPYRFERLPSQQTVAAQQDPVEGLSRSALAKVGMELNPPMARYSVQVVLNTQRVVRWSYDGWGDGSMFLAGGNRGASLGLSVPISEPDYFKRELNILMRDVATQQVVFETRALHNGVWSDTAAVLPAMLDAALSGFPEPPPGTRRINVEIPR